MKKLYTLIAFLLCAHLSNGQAWIMQNSGYGYAAAYPFDIDIVDANSVWNVAYAGDGSGVGLQLFSRTTDGGNLWTSGAVTLDTNFRFCGIAAIDSSTCYAMMYNNTVGSGGQIFKTVDGGMTWDTTGLGNLYATAASFPDVIYFWDAANGITIGDPVATDLEVYTTADSGHTWTALPDANMPNALSGEYGIVNDYVVVGDYIWVGTNKGRVFKSADRGQNWTVANVVNTANTVEKIAFRDTLNGMCMKVNTAGTSRTYYRTINGGATWTAFTPLGSFFPSEFMFVPGTSGMISCAASSTAGIGRGSSVSYDDGAHWTMLDTLNNGTTDGYTALDFIDASTGWAGGFAVDQLTDGIYRFGMTVGLNDHSTDVKSSGMNAYPNPSRDVFYLETSKSFKYDVKVEVLDMTGRVISSRTEAKFSSPYLMNLSDVNAGVYMVRISSGADVSTTRVVRQ